MTKFRPEYSEVVRYGQPYASFGSPDIDRDVYSELLALKHLCHRPLRISHQLWERGGACHTHVLFVVRKTIGSRPHRTIRAV